MRMWIVDRWADGKLIDIEWRKFVNDFYGDWAPQIALDPYFNLNKFPRSEFHLSFDVSNISFKPPPVTGEKKPPPHFQTSKCFRMSSIT